MLADDSIDVEVAPGHRITGATDGSLTRELVVADGETRMAPVQRWTYACSCGELAGADVDVAQAHAEEVTP